MTYNFLKCLTRWHDGTLPLIFSLCLWSHLLSLSPRSALNTLGPFHSFSSPGMFYLRAFALAIPSFFSQDIHMAEHISFFSRSLHKSPSQWGPFSQKLQRPSPHAPLVQTAFCFLFSLGHTTIWKLWAVGHTTWFCKYCFVGTQPYTFMYMLSVAVFILQWQSWTAVTETPGPQHLGCLLSSP